MRLNAKGNMGLISTLRNTFSSNKPSAGVVQDGESRWWGGSSSWLVGDTQAGEEVSEANLMQSATCFACTKALSETAAGLPASLMERLGQRKGDILRYSASATGPMSCTSVGTSVGAIFQLLSGSGIAGLGIVWSKRVKCQQTLFVSE